VQRAHITFQPLRAGVVCSKRTEEGDLAVSFADQVADGLVCGLTVVNGYRGGLKAGLAFARQHDRDAGEQAGEHASLVFGGQEDCPVEQMRAEHLQILRLDSLVGMGHAHHDDIVLLILNSLDDAGVERV